VAAPPLLDTNILVRHLTRDNPTLSPKATSYLGRIERGEIAASITDTVVFEAVFVLESVYKIPRTDIRDQVVPILEMQALRYPGKRRIREIFDLYVNRPALSFADCFHAVLVMRQGLAGIVSFDRGLDRVPGLVRVEPA
jgi:predicted nucleic acid-binding protein